jgi:N utilization substance protein B
MGIRRQAREIAVQVLYLLEFSVESSHVEDIFVLPEVEPLFKSISSAVKSYSSILITGVLKNRDSIDRFLSLSSENWSLQRMARVDKAILRIGIYEILVVSDVPASVAINEALEIAKIFSSDEAPMYINGVLDRATGILRSEGLIGSDRISDNLGDEVDSSYIQAAAKK